ncbi:clasp N terminal-domain-containing protein [Lipomyces oligophaga]|uniref:clasp N terminal-domain-containing protein n=1 Tax=Lipomyces oligophaga TaxID=45792 RepID=UPI0034CE97A4
MSLQYARLLQERLEQAGLIAADNQAKNNAGLRPIALGRSAQDSLVLILKALRSEFKHTEIDPPALPLYVRYLVLAANSPHHRVSQGAFGCLCHLVKRIYFQDQPRLRRFADDIVPVLLENLAGEEKVHDMARKALLDYWRSATFEIERNIRSIGLVHPRPQVRGEIVRFIVSLSHAEADFSVRTVLFETIALLNDSDPIVQNTTVECVVELHRNATSQSIFSLIAAMDSQMTDPAVSRRVLDRLGISSQQAPSRPLSTPFEEPISAQIPATVASLETVPSVACSDGTPLAQTPIITIVPPLSSISTNIGIPSRKRQALVSAIASRQISAGPSSCDDIKSISSKSVLSARAKKMLDQDPVQTMVQTPVQTPAPASSEPLTIDPTVSVTVSSSEIVQQILSTIPETETDSLDVRNVSSAEELETLVSSMVKSFEGKETETNWTQRLANVVTLRSITRGNAAKEYSAIFVASLKEMVDGICKAVSSLRTTLSTHGCRLIADLAVTLSCKIDLYADKFAQALIKLSAGTKKISGVQANAAMLVLLSKISFQQRLAALVSSACKDKNVTPRLFAATWLRLLLVCHADKREIIESAGCLESFESAIKGGLADANPLVRERMRMTFWNFHALWQDRADALIAKLDGNTSRALLKANPKSGEASATSTSSMKSDRSGFSKRSSATSRTTLTEHMQRTQWGTVSEPNTGHAATVQQLRNLTL